MADTSFETKKLAYRIDEAVKASGLGRSFLYERMASGELKSIKVGGRRLIFHTDLMDFLMGTKFSIPRPSVLVENHRLMPTRQKRALTSGPAQMEFPWSK
jgi:excisionase family DNA binding protein